MKPQNLILTLILGAALVPMVHADVTTTKPALKVDFNRMIDDGNGKKDELHKAVDQHASITEQDEKKLQKKAVTDFIDVEVSWGANGDQAPVVDRRFDSVGEARPANITALFDVRSLIYGAAVPSKLSPEI